jgi:hypothetical protein
MRLSAVTLAVICLFSAACSGSISPAGEPDASAQDAPDAAAQSDGAIEDGAQPDSGAQRDGSTTDTDADPGLSMLPFYPANHVVVQPIDNTDRFPVHAQSSSWTAAMLAANGGEDLKLDGYAAHPIFYVHNDVPMETFFFDRPYDSYSDHVLYATPSDYAWETDSSDHGGAVINVDTGDVYLTAYNDGRCNGTTVPCVDYAGNTYPVGTYCAGVGQVTSRNDLSAYHHPSGQSCSASGVTGMFGEITDADITSGSIDHALRMTMSRSSVNKMWPATHSSGSGTTMPPTGVRMRLRSEFDTTGYSGQALMVLTALKKYGGFNIENSGNTSWLNFYVEKGKYEWSYTMFLSPADGGLPGSRKTVHLTDFDFIDESALMVSETSYEANVF